LVASTVILQPWRKGVLDALIAKSACVGPMVTSECQRVVAGSKELGDSVQNSLTHKMPQRMLPIACAYCGECCGVV